MAKILLKHGARRMLINLFETWWKKYDNKFLPKYYAQKNSLKSLKHCAQKYQKTFFVKHDAQDIFKLLSNIMV